MKTLTIHVKQTFAMRLDSGQLAFIVQRLGELPQDC